MRVAPTKRLFALAQMDHNKYDVLISDLNIEKPAMDFLSLQQPTYPELGSYLRPIRLSIGWCRTWRSMITRFITQVNAAKRPKTMQPRTKR